jgi:hypothetical protein
MRRLPRQLARVVGRGRRLRGVTRHVHPNRLDVFGDLIGDDPVRCKVCTRPWLFANSQENTNTAGG